MFKYDYVLKLITRFDSVIYIYKYKILRSQFYEFLHMTLLTYKDTIKSYEVFKIDFDTLVRLDVDVLLD